MTEPTEDQTLRRARALCSVDGNAWDESDLEEGESAPVIDDSARLKYLNRAKEQLKWKARYKVAVRVRVQDSTHWTKTEAADA